MAISVGYSVTLNPMCPRASSVSLNVSLFISQMVITAPNSPGSSQGRKAEN